MLWENFYHIWICKNLCYKCVYIVLEDVELIYLYCIEYNHLLYCWNLNDFYRLRQHLSPETIYTAVKYIYSFLYQKLYGWYDCYDPNCFKEIILYAESTRIAMNCVPGIVILIAWRCLRPYATPVPHIVSLSLFSLMI